MKWIGKDMDTYSQAAEYIDTAVIPLIPAAPGKKMKDAVKMAEFTEYLAEYVEQQYTGRVFLLPPFTYLLTEPLADRMERLLTWQQAFSKEGFEHFLYLTADMDWRTADTKGNGELVWVPSFPLKGMDGRDKLQSIEQQAQQIIPIMTDKWTSSGRDDSQN
ncbi:YpiF family protein [Alkalicoccus luteus]|uniref:YpiF family protein n=1 Tax=Alkalicoccus luteus TaxID=1237094 RepID=A0A969PRT5_9BACI|nr:YpiF family protein [Alkalicoccus luteus]NJP38203.1 YpiF family protein [Alkalicoccus luteus]